MNSEITLIEALSMLEGFCPVKISLNDILLYDDYDGNENKPWQEVVPNRLWLFKDYVVYSIEITIVEFHHCIVEIKGRYEPYMENEKQWTEQEK